MAAGLPTTYTYYGSYLVLTAAANLLSLPLRIAKVARQSAAAAAHYLLAPHSY
jgi:hypothetical protein